MGDHPDPETSVAYTVTNGGRGASVRTNRWRYTRWGEEINAMNEELYDHQEDPEEHNNLARKPEMQVVLADLRKTFRESRISARQNQQK